MSQTLRNLLLLYPSGKAYYKKVLGISPGNLIQYLPQWEAAGGTAEDQSPEGNDGSYSGVTLGQPGIGDGRTCPFYDGANDHTDLYSLGLNADFNGQELSFHFWTRALNAGVWTDTTSRYLVHMYVDANNELYLRRQVANGQIYMRYLAGGVVKGVTVAGLSDTGWMAWGVSVSKTQDRLRLYLGGVQQGADQTGLGAWAGALLSTVCVLGAANIASASVWNGYEAHWALWRSELAPAQFARLATV